MLKVQSMILHQGKPIPHITCDTMPPICLTAPSLREVTRSVQLLQTFVDPTQDSQLILALDTIERFVKTR